jgi:hypothetical protein
MKRRKNVVTPNEALVKFFLIDIESMAPGIANHCRLCLFKVTDGI